MKTTHGPETKGGRDAARPDLAQDRAVAPGADARRPIPRCASAPARLMPRANPLPDASCSALDAVAPTSAELPGPLLPLDDDASEAP